MDKSTTTKIISGSAAAAAAIAGGVFLATDSDLMSQFGVNSIQTQVAAYSSDPEYVEIPTVTIPKVEITKVEIPKVEIPKVEIPRLEILEEITIAQAKLYGLDTIKVQAYGVETVSVPSVKVITSGVGYAIEVDGKKIEVADATVAAVVVAIPELAKVVVEKPNITSSEILSLMAKTPQISLQKIQQVAISIPKIARGDERIPEIQKFMARIQNIFKDKRMVKHDRAFQLDNQDIQKWLAIYEKRESFTLAYRALPEEKIKMVTEIHHPINFSILNENLEFYSKQGFTSVLITFGYEGENISDLIQAAELAKSKDFKIWFAYSGKESLYTTVFKNPDELAENLRRFARISEGFILGWRKTSLHLFEQDHQFTNFILKNVRSGNSQIYILGEAYYGQTASSNESTRNLQYNIPDNASGAAVIGLGYNGVAVESVMNSLLKKIKDYPKVVMIIGDRPYYATNYYNGKNFIENFQIKMKLVGRWMKAGARGVMVSHGDGSDGVYSKDHTDNLGATPVK